MWLESRMKSTKHLFELCVMDNMETSNQSETSQGSVGSTRSPNVVSLSLSNSLENMVFVSPKELGMPYLRITEQPVEKFRFRYKSEMIGTHGSILGISTQKSRTKMYPAVELLNCNHEAIVRCSLYTADEKPARRRPHTHRLVVRRENEEKDDPHDILVAPEHGYVAVFHGMGIIHTAKKHIAEELMKKKRVRMLETIKVRNINNKMYQPAVLSMKEELRIRAEAEEEVKGINLNSVTLCFEAFRRDEQGLLRRLCAPVFSNPINNMKSALTGELKICRMDKHVSSCLGGDEIFLFVEKVGKKNIKIKIFELDEDDVPVWHDYGRFSELDVHHQYAIAFRTPAFRDQSIEESVDVFIQLVRPTDGDCSEPLKFTYKPADRIVLGGKRRCEERSPLHSTAMLSAAQEIDLEPVILGSVGLNSGTDLFRHMLEEDGMNSSEFKDFVKNLSISDYMETYTAEQQMDMTTDAVKGDIFTASHNQNSEEICETRRKDKVSESNSVVVRESAGVTARTAGGDVVASGRPTTRKNASSDNTASLVDNFVSELKDLLLLKPQPEQISQKVSEMLSVKNSSNDSILHLYVFLNKWEEMKEILKVIRRVQLDDLLNMQNNKGRTALHIAALVDQPQMIRVLLDAGADPNLGDKTGNRPLHSSILQHTHSCTSQLINQKLSARQVKLQLQNDKGFTPLHTAVQVRNMIALTKLLEAGADVNIQDGNSGRTALHLAVENCSVILTSFLVKQIGIDVNLANYAGNTPLHAACVLKNDSSLEICRLLIDHDANPHLANYSTVRVKGEPHSADESTDLVIHIKEEDCDDEYTEGQTSYDLASDNDDILKILDGAKKEIRDYVSDPDELLDDTLVIKEESSDVVERQALSRVAAILDRSGNWQDLALLMEYGFLIPTYKDEPSPCNKLFHYAEARGGVTMTDYVNLLEAIAEHEAAEIIRSLVI